jgi:ubiquinol-cytochrome c reductase cytochrome c subunit
MARPEHLRLVPVTVALAVALAVWIGGQAAATEEPEHDPLGYVIDLDALDDPATIAAGDDLFSTGCVSCHGAGGVGAPGGPAVVDAGAASAHFYLTSGRMPAAVRGDAQPERKRPAYAPEEIEALVAYVASLGDGLAIPLIDPASGDLAHGGELYRLNCAGCHSATGAGGALSYGRNAPTLAEATPVQVAEATRVGPGQMPRFTAEVLSDEEVDSIVRYVQFLQTVEDPGGFALGRVGPIPEGFVAIVIGLGATLLAAFWIGKRRLESEDTP